MYVLIDEIQCKFPPKSVTITSNSLHPLILNCVLGKVESIFDSEIKNISKFVIVSAIISNLFLMELSIERFKTLYFNFCLDHFQKNWKTLKCLENFAVKYLKKESSACSQSYPNYPFKLN